MYLNVKRLNKTNTEKKERIVGMWRFYLKLVELPCA